MYSEKLHKNYKHCSLNCFWMTIDSNSIFWFVLNRRTVDKEDIVVVYLYSENGILSLQIAV